MPKRKISDLWPNECIHCPDEWAAKIMLRIATNIDYIYYNKIIDFYQKFLDSYIMTIPWINWGIWLCIAKKRLTNSYARTDFIDGWKKESDTNHVVSWPFKTGDEVEVFTDETQRKTVWFFVWYTTNGTYIVQVEWRNREYLSCYKLVKQQHTISCTDETLEKIKEIEGVEFIL